MRFEYAPGATPIDLDEAKGLIPAHLTLQRELNEYEETNILEATEWLPPATIIASLPLVFISHAWPEDDELTRWLCDRLTAHGYRVWADLQQLLGGDPFLERHPAGHS